MRSLVLGGTGFLGRQVVQVLLERGHEVTVIHRGEHEVEDGARHAHGDRSEMAALVRGLEFDAFIDIRPMNDKDSQVVIDALRGRVRRTVHASSVDVYEAYDSFRAGIATEPVPFNEDAPVRRKIYPYRGQNPRLEDYDKILMEQAVLGAGSAFPACVMRFPVLYGPHDRQRREWSFLRRILDGRPVIMGGGSLWLFHRMYIRDAARAMVLAAEQDEAMGRIFNAGEPRTLTMLQWAHAIGEACGRKADVRIVPDTALPEHLRSLAGHQQHLLVDTGRIRAALGYAEERPAAETIRLSVQWHMANPPSGDEEEYRKQLALEEEVLRA
jgi:nucleoside-diphosphate-sugar epimerase